MEKITSPSYIKYLLDRYGTQAKKQFGQNFLISEHVLAQIVAAADIQPTDTIIEVGPGLGALTRELCLRAKKIVALEKDRTMLEVLKETILQETPNAKNKITFLEHDALNFDPSTDTLTTQPYKLVANLPYNVATPILENFLVRTAYNHTQPERIVVLVQKEVAEKICAKTGDHSVLSLAFQPFGSAQIVSTVPASVFFPAPKVTSAILHITPHASPLLTEDILPVYIKLLHAAFSQKRKMLHTSLTQILTKDEVATLLTKAGISPDIRPQNMSLESWITLAKAFSAP